MRISDWSSDVCSSDLMLLYAAKLINRATLKEWNQRLLLGPHLNPAELKRVTHGFAQRTCRTNVYPHAVDRIRRSEEHTSELQSLMRISYAVFCLKKKQERINNKTTYKFHTDIRR